MLVAPLRAMGSFGAVGDAASNTLFGWHWAGSGAQPWSSSCEAQELTYSSKLSLPGVITCWIAEGQLLSTVRSIRMSKGIDCYIFRACCRVFVSDGPPSSLSIIQTVRPVSCNQSL